MKFITTWLKQEVAVTIFVIGTMLIGGGVGCSLIKAPSPITGEKVSGEQLSAEAVEFQRETGVKMASILTQINTLEMEYTAIVDDHELVAEAFSDTYDLLEKKKEGVSALFSQGLAAVGGMVPGPWQPAFALLGGLGTVAFGGGYVRKEMVIKKRNREAGRGPRGERLPE